MSENYTGTTNEKINPPLHSANEDNYYGAEAANDDIAVPSYKESEPQSKIEELKTQIAEINSLNAKMKPEEADAKVAELETEIHKLENNDESEAVPEVAAEDLENSPEAEEKAEYLRLKGEFKQAERAYYDAVAEDYTTRDHLSKFFGLGREKMNPSVQEKYDKFMAANNSYYKFAQKSGTYQKIAERINREKSPEEQVSANPSIASRHILNPAEKRLELQTVKMPEGLRKLKEGLVNKIKKHPKALLAVGTMALAINPAMVGALAARVAVAAGAGLATRYLGGEFYLKQREEKQKNLQENSADMVQKWDELDLEAMEKEYFSATNTAHNARNRVKMASVVAAGAAGATFSAEASAAFGTADAMPAGEGVNDIGYKAVGSGVDDYPQVPVNETIPHSNEEEIRALYEQADTSENIHTVKSGENVSTILFDSIKARLADGQLTLPEGVGKNDIAHFMYQSFPEMTDAADVAPRLTPDQWRELGISSGDPNLIQPGEEINIQALIDKMRSGSELTITDSAPVSAAETVAPQPPVEVVNSDSSVENNPTSTTEAVELSSLTVNSPEVQSLVTEYGWKPEQVVNFLNRQIEDGVSQEAAIDSFRQLADMAEKGFVDMVQNGGEVPQASERVDNVVGEELLDSGVIDEIMFSPEVRGHAARLNMTPAELMKNLTDPQVFEAARKNGLSVMEYLRTHGVENVNSAVENSVAPEAVAEYAWTPSVSERFVNVSEITYKDDSNLLHEHLAKAMVDGYKSGDISLPKEIESIVDKTAFADSLIIEMAPELSNSWLENGKPTLTPEEWQALGVSSGDPTKIRAGDTVRIGEVFKALFDKVVERRNGI